MSYGNFVHSPIVRAAGAFTLKMENRKEEVMKRWKQLRIVLAVGAALGSLAVSPSISNGEVIIHLGGPVIVQPVPQPVVYQYTYYPDAEVYYAPDTRLYWWLNGSVWISGPAVPTGIVLGPSVALRVDGP